MHCFSGVNPPSAPAASNLNVSWAGSPVPVGNDVVYECHGGYRFASNITLDSFNVACETGYVWETIATWPVCVESKWTL